MEMFIHLKPPLMIILGETTSRNCDDLDLFLGKRI